MISYIRGELTDVAADHIVLEANQIGYHIMVPASVIMQLPAVGSEIKIYTYLHVREDAMVLFGFYSKDDLAVFKLLLGVSGIGPKGALGILGCITPDDLRFAVLSDDVKTITKCPGIGTKTAQRLIIELKDKLKLSDALENISGRQEISEISVNSDAKGEAVQALTALGYSAGEALKAVKQVERKEDMTVEEILKAALKKISFL